MTKAKRRVVAAAPREMMAVDGDEPVDREIVLSEVYARFGEAAYRKALALKPGETLEVGRREIERVS